MIQKTRRGAKPATLNTINSFAQMIVQSRRSLGLTQKLAAEKVGIDYRHFQDIEKGKVDIRMSSLLELQSKLGLNLEQLFCNQFGTSTCPACIDKGNSDELWQSLNVMAEGGKCGMLIMDRKSFIFANKYFLEQLNYPDVSKLKTMEISAVSEPSLATISEKPTIAKFFSPERGGKDFIVFSRKQGELVTFILISPELAHAKLKDVLNMLPLYNVASSLGESV